MTAAAAPAALTSGDVRALIRRRYQAPEWLVLDEAGIDRMGRTIDVLVLNLYPSRGHRIIGIEIKVSRADWRRELRDPSKAEGTWRLCHQLYVAAPKGVVADPDGELPPGWGLLVPFGASVTDIPARGGRRGDVREPDDMSRTVALGLLAKAFSQAPVSHDTLQASMQTEYRRGRDDGERRNAEEARYAREGLDRLRETVATFETASGVRISQYDAGPIGEAVKLVATTGGRHGGLSPRFWRLFADSVDAAIALAQAVAELGGPHPEPTFRGSARDLRHRDLYDLLRQPDPVVVPPEAEA